MSNIKFQEDGANFVCKRMKEEGKNRFLLADEVGLGKTITAAQIIGKMKPNDNTPFRVGYICGNEALANENIRKLKQKLADINVVVSERRSERLSLGFKAFIPSKNANQKTNRGVEIYTLTPSTTIKVTSKGRKDERAYAYMLLADSENDVLLEEACKGKANSIDDELDKPDTFDYELGKAKDTLGEDNLKQFRESIRVLFKSDEGWGADKNRCFENFYNTLLTILYYEDISFSKDEMVRESKRLVEKCKGFETKYLKQLIEIEFKKKRLTKDIIDALNVVLNDSEFQKSQCTIGIISDLISFLQKKDMNNEIVLSPAYMKKIQKKYRKEEISVANKQNVLGLILEVYKETICKEMLRTMRKCMAVQSVKMMNMTLFLADEIQNYSEIFMPEKRKKNTEMDLVINHLIRGENNKIVLMSATPFRYRIKHNKLENAERDANADDDKSVETWYNNDNTAQQYLENESDIYDEFVGMIRYLLNDDSKTKEWLKKWQCICNEKFSLISQNYSSFTEKNIAIDRYKELTREQSAMLKETGISRVERYMSGEIVKTEMQNTVLMEGSPDANRNKELRNILKTELRRMPGDNVEAEILDEYSVYFKASDGEWYSYKDDRVLKANQILSGFIFPDVEEYEFYELHDDYLEMSDYNDLNPSELDRKIKALNTNILVRKDYVKSTPAFFSFKLGYARLEGMFDFGNMHTLSKDRVERYDKLFADGSEGQINNDLIYNARIAWLFKVLFDDEEIHKLLFIPPSRGDVQLKGVFEGKRGVSKRLFFTDYNMTPKSLSALLSYEADRRTIADIKCLSFKVVPNCDLEIDVDKLRNFSSCIYYDDPTKIVNKLYEYDKQLCDEKQSDEHLKKGSPYAYAKKRKLSNDELFCKAYFKYMIKLDSLRVLAAYSSGDSLYDKIVNYGADGCIGEVFDEYLEYIPRDNDTDEGKSFSDVISFNPNAVYALVNKGNELFYSKMPVSFAVGHFAGDRVVGSASRTLNNKIRQFNSPFRPMQFISTSIGQEGFDFHLYCRKLVHWSLKFNPVEFEQRDGRINRYQSYANRLNLYDRFYSKNQNFSSWHTAFEDVINQERGIVKKSRGLFPDFTVSTNEVGFPLVRECYYYPFSFEESKVNDVLKAVGYYRALLGQSSQENFEDAFRSFVDGIPANELPEFFINLYPT